MSKEILLNETAVKALGFTNDSAPGKYLSHYHNGKIYNYKIAGVIKDYHIFSMHAPIFPLGLMIANPLRFTLAIAKVNGRDVSKVIKQIEKQYKQLNPDTPFNYDFLSNNFKYDYVQDQRQQQMAGVCAGIAIFISCLGLLGLITYTVGQKAKEISIRKVIGAGVVDIVMLFSKDYLRLVLLANLVAGPVAWLMMNKWLQDFSYRIAISWWMFGVPLLIVMLLAFSTLILKSIRAAHINPIINLRAE